MKKYTHLAAILTAGTTFLLAAIPAMSASTNVDINIGVPGIQLPPPPVIVQPHPIVVQPRPLIVQSQPVYEEREDRYWDCKKGNCKQKKFKHHKHHKHHDHGHD